MFYSKKRMRKIYIIRFMYLISCFIFTLAVMFSFMYLFVIFN